jgi:hypothetical protein
MNNIKIKLKTSELTGAALDWAVAKCEVGDAINEIDDPHFYSTDWALAGPIIEREKIEPRGPTMVLRRYAAGIASNMIRLTTSLNTAQQPS